MQFDWWTFAFQVINVAVLIWILGRFLFKPVARIIEERRAETAETLRQAEDTRLKSEEARQALQQEREEFRKQRFDLLEDTRTEAEHQKQEIVSKARQEAAAIIANAERAAERNAAANRKKNLGDAVSLSVAVADRALENMPSDARISGYAKRLEAAVSNLDERQKAALALEPGKLELVSARALTAGERKQALKAIAQLTDADHAVQIVTDESLIAGLEVRTPHGVVHNSLRFDLERMAKVLADEAQR